MKPINVYVPPRSMRIALGDEDAEKLIHYVFQALDKLDINQVLKLSLSDVDLITYPCLMQVIRRLTNEMSKGGKYYNKFMAIYDLPGDSYYRKEMLNIIKAVIDTLELPILLVGNATIDLGSEFKVIGSVFYSHPYIGQVFNYIREEEKKGNKSITANTIATKLNMPTMIVSHILRRLHSFRLLIREYSLSSKSAGKYQYVTVVSKAIESE